MFMFEDVLRTLIKTNFWGFSFEKKTENSKVLEENQVGKPSFTMVLKIECNKSLL